MTRQGTVTKIENDVVSVASRPLECCSGGGSCHCLQTEKAVTFRARWDGSFPVQIGDYVEAGVETVQTGVGALKVFALPLTGFLLGWLGFSLSGFAAPVPLAAGFGGAVLGLALGFWIFKPQKQELPRILKVIQPQV